MPSIRSLAFTLVIFSAIAAPAITQDQPKPRQIAIEVGADGFKPSSVDVKPNEPIELVFTRKAEKTCATEVSVPSLKIKKPLPLNEPVSIALTPEKNEITFACGMNMLKGKLVVK
jgi:plastocyanin domain-containing protein